MSEKMRVACKRCDECLYSTAKIVSDRRRDEVLRTCERSGRAFNCHKATLVDEQIVCRGHFDADDSLVVVLAKMLDRVEFVELP